MDKVIQKIGWKSLALLEISPCIHKTGSFDVMKKMNYDEFDGGEVSGVQNPRRTPYTEAPGIVWKILSTAKTLKTSTTTWTLSESVSTSSSF